MDREVVAAGDEQRTLAVAPRSGDGEPYRQGLERIFRLLGLLFDPHDMYTAYRGLGSARPEVRGSALELLDTLLPLPLRRLIVPLVDDEMALADKLKRAPRVSVPAPVAARE